MARERERPSASLLAVFHTRGTPRVGHVSRARVGSRRAWPRSRWPRHSAARSLACDPTHGIDLRFVQELATKVVSRLRFGKIETSNVSSDAVARKSAVASSHRPARQGRDLPRFLLKAWDLVWPIRKERSVFWKQRHFIERARSRNLDGISTSLQKLSRRRRKRARERLLLELARAQTRLRPTCSIYISLFEF